MNQMLPDIFNNFSTFNCVTINILQGNIKISMFKKLMYHHYKKLYDLLVSLFGMKCLMLLTITVHFLFINVVSNIYYLKH